MSKQPRKIDEFYEFLKIVAKRLEVHSKSLNKNRVDILEVLFENDEHLSRADIEKILNDKGIFLKDTYVYSQLDIFEIYGIVESIVVDNIKRYELAFLKKQHFHLHCQECHKIIEFEDLDIFDMFLNKLNDLNFKPTKFNVIIHGVCKQCLK